MSLTDAQIESLEEYLDGALKGDDAAAVGARLTEPAYAAAMQALRGERLNRRSFFAANEPGDLDVERFVAGVKLAAAKQRNTSRFARVLRIGAAIAACVAVSFITGWQLRGQRTASTPAGPGALHGVATAAKVSTPVTYHVALTDERGQVTAVQSFDSLEQAKEFSQDLSRWQQRQEQLRNGAAVIVADRF